MESRIRIGHLALSKREIAVLQNIVSLVPQFAGKYDLLDRANTHRSHIVLINHDYPLAQRWFSAIRKHNRFAIPLMLSSQRLESSGLQLKRPIQAGALINALETVITQAMEGLVRATDTKTSIYADTLDVIRILVVDDSTTIRDHMEYTLPRIDHRRINVKFASSGEEALELLADESFDMVFLDIVMSGVDGYKVCKKIAADGVSHVVLLTSRKSRIDKMRGALAGCDAFITKPPTLEQLRAEISRCWQKRDQLRHELTDVEIMH